MHTEVNREIVGFSWENILANSQEFERYPLNPSIFETRSISAGAAIATRGNEIDAIHPYNRKTLDFVSEKLSIAVSQYYKCKVSVEIIEESSVIKVSF